MKYRFLGLFLVLAVAAGLMFLRERIVADDGTEPSLPRAAARVAFAVGIVEGLGEKTELRFETVGRIDEVMVSEGDHILGGTPLASLDRREAVAQWELANAHLAKAQAEYDSERAGTKVEQIRMAEAELRAKQAQLETERLGLDRITSLLRDGTVPQQQFDDQAGIVDALGHEVQRLQARLQLLHNPTKQQTLEAMLAAIRAAESQVELARLKVERCDLVSPFSGIVVDVEMRRGELVERVGQSPSITMVDDSVLRVRAQIEEHDAFDVREGMPVRVRLQSNEDQVYKGRVARLSPKLSQKLLVGRSSDERFDVRTRECWIDLEDSTGLVLFAHVDVEILISPSESSAGSADREDASTDR